MFLSAANPVYLLQNTYTMNKLLAFILCIAAITVWAQTDSTPSKVYRIDMHQKAPINNNPEQRHPTSDLILKILNINSERLPVIIEYYNDAETIQLAGELKDELTYQHLAVSLLQAADTTQPLDNKRNNNFRYRITDSSFIITTFPKNRL